MARKLALACLLTIVPWVRGQEHPDPPLRPAPQPIAPASTPASTPSPKAPAVKDDSIPGLEDADFRLTPAPLRREGSFILRQRGSMVRLPGGERAIIFHRDAQGRAERPMVLLPCLTLQSMETVAGDGSKDTAFLVSGQVYVYHGVNYLLPTAAPVASGAEPAPAPKAAETEPSKDPAVEDLIRGLEAQKDRPRTLGGGGGAPKETQAGPTDLLAENSIISLKRGRLVRLASGEWAFTFDNDTSGEAAADRTLVINPCLNLQRLEAWASKLGDGATILMSGRVFQYQGRNHIMPTMHQVAAPNDLSPRQ